MNPNSMPGRYRHQATVVINASAADTWAVMADFSAADNWAPQVTNSYALGDSDKGIGAGRHCDIQGFGGVQEYITEWTEGESYVYEVTPLGPLGRSFSHWSVEPISANQCRATTAVALDVRFGILGRIMYHLVLKSKLNGGVKAALGALKTRVETGKTVRKRRSPPGRPQLKAA